MARPAPQNRCAPSRFPAGSLPRCAANATLDAIVQAGRITTGSLTNARQTTLGIVAATKRSRIITAAPRTLLVLLGMGSCRQHACDSRAYDCAQSQRSNSRCHGSPPYCIDIGPRQCALASSWNSTTSRLFRSRIRQYSWQKPSVASTPAMSSVTAFLIAADRPHELLLPASAASGLWQKGTITTRIIILDIPPPGRSSSRGNPVHMVRYWKARSRWDPYCCIRTGHSRYSSPEYFRILHQHRHAAATGAPCRCRHPEQSELTLCA